MKDPNFSGYYAKQIERPLGMRQKLGRLKQQAIYDVLLLPYGLIKHRHLLETCDRLDNHTYTCFHRAPAQLRTVSGPVLDFLRAGEPQSKRLEILTFACSNGAEVYTMASWLSRQVPSLDFHITASDLHDEMVNRCIAGDYSEAEALQSDYITKDIVESTFEKRGDRYHVLPHLREKTTFRQADLLDREGLEQKFQPADIVTAQNVLFHLKPDDTRKAFGNVVSFLKPRSALLVEGMDLDLRVELTLRHGLRPLTDNLRQVYNETRVHTPKDWWQYYWGTEPFLAMRPDRDRRYATIFLKG